MEGPTRQEEDEASPAVEQKQSLKLSRKLARMDSALAELRSLHRLHSAWVDAGFTTNVVGDQRVAQSAGEENDEEERNLLEVDEDDGGSSGGWKFAPSRSSWATGEEDGCDAAAATSPSTSFINSHHHAAGPSLLSTSGALVSPSMPRLACEDEEGVEVELELDDDDEGVPIPDHHHHDKAQGATSLASAMSSPGGSGSSPPSSSSPSSREVSGEKSPASQRRRVALLRTKSNQRDEWTEGEVRSESRKGQYDGTYDSEGSKDGAGRFVYGDGGLYEGEWEKDQRHGFGTMTYASGEKYQGQWVEDRKEGTGTYTWRQGQYLYSGQWKNGQRWGKASFRFGNGVWYFEGEWKEDAPCPEGLLRGPHLSYVGEVMAVITSARGMRHAPYTLYQHGHGTGTYAQGDRYFGNWKKGKRDAFGVYIGRQGERFFGNWRDDQPRGLGLWIHADGTQYLGEFDKGKPSGKGQLRFANGDALDGVQWNGDLVLKALYTRAAAKGQAGSQWATNPKWVLFVGDALEQHEEHPLELLMERWVAFFKWSYAPLPSYETKEAVRNQLRSAVEDVNSFIDYLVQEVRFADNCPQQRNLLRRFVGRYVLTYTHSSIFSLYRRVNKKTDARLSIKMKSLGRATTRDLGIAENFQLAQQSPFSPAEDLTRQARGRAFLGSHKADTNTDRKATLDTRGGKSQKQPYKEAIKLLGALPNTPPYEKAQRLLSVSEAVIDAVRKYWLFRSPNTDMSAMMGAEEKFPIFTYLVLKADIPNLFSELQYVSDFIRQQSFGPAAHYAGGSDGGGGCIEAEAKYRLAELEAAVNYLLTLNWSVRDSAGVLVPRAWVEQRLRDAIGDLAADVRQLTVDDRPTVELMHQHAGWTTDLLTTMGLDIDLPLPAAADANNNNSDDSNVGPKPTTAATNTNHGAIRAHSPSLVITLRVRHSPETYLRFAELVTRAT
ncbi:MORN repeatcontaining protein [Acanthamoeba castellanii str. Neff]|uniref:MORN repeatcontaining protein n=1 Tax=Acanthamoeba castellanii (strain ATCC 30010 / Neff) TaxID=1257118 RepID=L8GY36_ACACF|nr:MORN repeatcontaining protein [Acanthamoeba castellanii str. Neff]ELR18159.1 MORN repeatcontaining protein [Acanthamoeba castellanii str. Neff]